MITYTQLSAELTKYLYIDEQNQKLDFYSARRITQKSNHFSFIYVSYLVCWSEYLVV